MKKSEFLNKTKEELEALLDEISKYDYEDDSSEILQFVKMLITNESVLKMASKTKEDREKLLVLAETVKGVAKAMKFFTEETTRDVANEGLTEEEVMEINLKAAEEAGRRSAEIEKDFEDDVEAESEEEIIGSLLNTVTENFDLDEDTIEELREELREGIREDLQNQSEDDGDSNFDFFGDELN